MKNNKTMKNSKTMDFRDCCGVWSGVGLCVLLSPALADILDKAWGWGCVGAGFMRFMKGFFSGKCFLSLDGTILCHM